MGQPSPTIVMGIDPGSRITGYGIISVLGNHCRCIEYGAIRCHDRRLETPFEQRLKTIYHELGGVLRRHAPSVAAVESVFHAVNARSALQLGHARGVVLLAAAELEIPLFEYSPREVKKSISVSGRATKEEVQTMVRILLKLKGLPRPKDAADALAVALCHAFKGVSSLRLQQQARLAR